MVQPHGVVNESHYHGINQCTIGLPSDTIPNHVTITVLYYVRVTLYLLYNCLYGTALI